LKILDSKMRKDDETRIKYASKYAGISNYHKKWSGESLGLKKSNAVEKRKEYEKEFLSRIAKDENLKKQYEEILTEFEDLYNANEEYQLAEIYFDEAIYRNSETFRVALLLNNLIDAYEEKSDVEDYKNRLVNYLKGLYKNYDADLDEEVSLALIKLYTADVPKSFYQKKRINISAESFKNSFITGKKDFDGIEKISNTEKAFENTEMLIEVIKSDPIIQEIRKIKTANEEKVSPKYLEIQNQLSQLQRTYMKAQLEVFPEKKFFPDANSTL